MLLKLLNVLNVDFIDKLVPHNIFSRDFKVSPNVYERTEIPVMDDFHDFCLDHDLATI